MLLLFFIFVGMTICAACDGGRLPLVPLLQPVRASKVLFLPTHPAARCLFRPHLPAGQAVNVPRLLPHKKKELPPFLPLLPGRMRAPGTFTFRYVVICSGLAAAICGLAHWCGSSDPAVGMCVLTYVCAWEIGVGVVTSLCVEARDITG